MIAKNLSTTIRSVQKIYNKFLRITLHADWNEVSDAFLLLFILKYNHHANIHINIEKIYKEIKGDETYEIACKKLIESTNLEENSKARTQITSKLVNEKFALKIDRQHLGIAVDFDDIFFHNIITECNSLIDGQKVHKIHLLPKIKSLSIEYNIKTYEDVFEAYEKCIKLAFETKLLDKFVNMV